MLVDDSVVATPIGGGRWNEGLPEERTGEWQESVLIL